MQTIRLEPELEGDGAPARELAGAGKFARAGLHTLQSLAQVSPLSCHEGKSSAGPGLTAGTLRVTPNEPGIVHKDTGYASMGRPPRVRQAAGKGITFSASIVARMEILFLISVLVFVAIYAAYREWLNAAHRRWLGELDLYKKRLSAYEELKRAVGPLRAAGQVSQDDADRFARTMSDMRFLFDKEFDSFVGALHGALVKKHALDALLEKAANYAHSPEDQALTDMAKRRSRELASQITEAIDREMPERMERFLQPRPII